MFLDLQEVKYKKPVPIHKYWMINPEWQTSGFGSFIPGDCSKQDQGIFDKCIFGNMYVLVAETRVERV